MFDCVTFFIYDHHQHLFAGLIFLLCVALLLIGQQTVTPASKPHGRPFSKKLLIFFPLWVLLSSVAYFYTGFAFLTVVVLTLFCANGILKIWYIKGLEKEYDEFVRKATFRNRRLGLLCIGGYCFLFFLLGMLLIVFSPGYSANWGFWFGVGLIYYAILTAVCTTVYLLKIGKSSSIYEEMARGERGD
jgi:hypothetical protein